MESNGRLEMSRFRIVAELHSVILLLRDQRADVTVRTLRKSLACRSGWQPVYMRQLYPRHVTLGELV